MQQLRDTLEELAAENDKRWFAALAKRKVAELEFHNACRDTAKIETLPRDTYEQLHGNKKFYGIVGVSTEFVERWIEERSRGKIFLDYACGNGANAIKAARSGATLSIGLDISDISVENARRLAAQAGVGEKSFFLQADCERTRLPDNCVDVVVCSGMLHHLDVSYAFHELRRILRPGGVVLAVEALDYNPAIKLYRCLTPQMRTEWERNHILSLRDLAFAKRFFDVKNVRYWHLFSIAGVYFPRFLPLLKLMDSLTLRLPVIRLAAWMWTFELHKRDE